MMTEGEIEKILIPHLGGQFERATPTLFTGAGFSRAAKNILGNPVPTAFELKQILWDLSFTPAPYEEGNSLQDLYEHALQRHRARLTELLTNVLTVDADSLPAWYRQVFSISWSRSYTLNVDDLPAAVSRRYELPRRLVPLSATRSSPGDTRTSVSPTILESIHLNGTVPDIPDLVTFSTTQYGERLARQDPWYGQLGADLLTHPFVFIGTNLDEPPLWQHIELRRHRGGRDAREFRHRSYLISPSLPLAKQALLARFNIFWVAMSAEEFTDRILVRLHPKAQVGIQLLTSHPSASSTTAQGLPLVSALAVRPTQKSEFLLGAEPIWADIQADRAIVRETEPAIWRALESALARNDTGSLVVITGTTATGKSTALKRACLKLTAEGISVGWVDRETDLSPRDIRRAMLAEDAPRVLAIDDADVFGSEITAIVREVVGDARAQVVIVAIRAGRIDTVLDIAATGAQFHPEIAMPPLTDADIGDLLDALDRGNRLGSLKGKPRAYQVARFREYCGRHLIVAMMEATSGEPFERKIAGELEELEVESRYAYAVVAVASAFRFSLTRDEIVLAAREQSNTLLNAIETLVRRHVIVAVTDGVETLRARHRVIADVIVERLTITGQLKEAVAGLVFVAAAKVSRAMRRTARPYRLLRQLINHDFLRRTLGMEGARSIYGGIEQLLEWDSHFWLQRGSLEVEGGDLARAENFLDQAAGLAPDDPFVETERSYLQFRRALEVPGSIQAPRLVAEATASLEDLIVRRGMRDAYPYHILGSQGLAWTRRGIARREEKARYLNTLVQRLKDGIAKNPRDVGLCQLEADLQKELLSLAVPT